MDKRSAIANVRHTRHAAAAAAPANGDDGKPRLLSALADVGAYGRTPLPRLHCRLVAPEPADICNALRDGRSLALMSRDADAVVPPTGAAGDDVVSVRTSLADAVFDDCLSQFRSVTIAALEGFGENPLHVAFGFVGSAGGEGLEGAATVPLILLPVRFQPSAWHDCSGEFRLEATGPAIWPSAALLDLAGDEGWPVPTVWPTDQTLTEAIAQVAGALEDAPEVRVHQHVALVLCDEAARVQRRDIDPSRWPENHPLGSRPLVAALSHGLSRSGSADARRALTAPAPVPPGTTILAADAQQRAAIADVMAGHSVVIEGAPGTGKSQTIANIVGATLEEGRTVLLVAQQRSALEAVRVRMAEAGLGELCLFSHGRHVDEGDVRRRLDKLGHRPLSESAEPLQKRIVETEEALRALARPLSRRTGRLDLTAGEILWGAARYRAEVPLARIGAVDLGDPTTIDALTVERCETALDRYVSARSAVGGDRGDPTDHPWHGVTKAGLNPSEWSALADALSDWRRTTAAVSAALEDVSELTGIAWPDGPEAAARLAALSVALPASERDIYPALLSQITDRTVADEMLRLSGRLKRLREIEQAGEAALGTFQGLSEAEAGDLLRALATARALLPAACTVASARRLAALAMEAEQLIGQLKRGFAALSARLGNVVGFNAPGLMQLRETIELAVAPPEALSRRPVLSKGPDTEAMLRKAQQEAAALRRMERNLDEIFDLSKAPSSRVLAEAIRDMARAGPLRAFSGDWRKADKLYRSIARSDRGADRTGKLANLERLMAYQEHVTAFARHVGYRKALGRDFKGIATDFQPFERLLDWQRTVREQAEALGNEALGRVVLALPEQDLQALADLPNAIPEWYAGLARLIEIWPEVAPLIGASDEPFDTLEDRIASARRTLGALDDRLAPIKADPSLALSRIDEDVALMREYRGLRREIDGSGPLADRLAARTVRIREAVPKRLGRTASIAVALSALTPAAALRDWLAADEGRLGTLRECLSPLQERCGSCQAAFEAFAELGHVERDLWLSQEGPTASYPGIRQRADKALEALASLSDWVDYLRASRKLDGLGMARLGKLVAAGTLTGEQAKTAFLALVFDGAAGRLLQDHPILAANGRAELAALAERLSADQTHRVEIVRARVAQAVDEAGVAAVQGRDRQSIEEELGGVAGDSALDMRWAPESTGLRQALQPCFMMSPQAIAELLEPSASFDLVIFDEASHIPVADAIGGLARARQAVVFGDSYDPTADTGTDGDPEAGQTIRAGTMLLEVARAAWPRRHRLTVHYADNDAQLFAFVNRSFYEREQRLMPSPRAFSNDSVARIAVADSVFEQGQNKAEAEMVADAAVAHMVQNPGDSLGIVALRREQATLIESCLRQRMAQSPAAQAYAHARESGEEPPVVRSAETVHGLVRDTILVSVSFGPNRNGQVLQSFAPLDADRGPQAIQLLATGARRRMRVFASMMGRDVLLSADTAKGVRMLRSFLEFAEEGCGACSRTDRAEDVSDLAVVVTEALAARGLTAESLPELAACGLDLAVRDPDDPSVFLLGLMDATRVGRGARGAAESPLAQHATLVSLGWHVHWLHAGDWLRDPKGEARQLTERIAGLQAAEQRRTAASSRLGDSVVAFRRALLASDQTTLSGEAREPSLTPAEARSALVALRDRVVRTAAPAIDPARALLRDPILDFLLQERPRSVEEFRNGIPPEQLERIDAGQLDAHLEDALAIVVRIAG